MKLPMSTKCFSLLAAAFLFVRPAAGQPVTVLSPNGGESFAVGETLHVRWMTDTNVVFNVNIEMSVDSGDNFYKISNGSIQIVDPEWGDYAWVVPDSLGGAPTVSSRCFINIYDYFGRSRSDLSDAVFSIIAVRPPPVPDPVRKSGCGSGAIVALIPPMLLTAGGRLRRRRHGASSP